MYLELIVDSELLWTSHVNYIFKKQTIRGSIS